MIFQKPRSQFTSRSGRAVLLLSSVLAFGLFADHAEAADTVAEQQSELYRAIFSDATMTLHLRSYLLDRTDTTGSDPAAWASGGWIGYELDWIGDILKFGAVGYTSLPLWAPEDRDGSLLLKAGRGGIFCAGPGLCRPQVRGAGGDLLSPAGEPAGSQSAR